MKTKQEIENNALIDNFIHKEVKLQPNPYLVSKIMARIEREADRQNQHTAKGAIVLQRLVIAAGIVLALFTGILLGNIYNNPTDNHTTALLINDSYIENLELFNEQPSNNL